MFHGNKKCYGLKWHYVTAWYNKENYKYCILKYYQTLEYACVFRSDFHVPISDIQVKIFTEVSSTWTFACRCKLRSILRSDSLLYFVRICLEFFYFSLGAHTDILLSPSYTVPKFTVASSAPGCWQSKSFVFFSGSNCYYLIYSFFRCAFTREHIWETLRFQTIIIF